MRSVPVPNEYQAQWKMLSTLTVCVPFSSDKTKAPSLVWGHMRQLVYNWLLKHLLHFTCWAAVIVYWVVNASKALVTCPENSSCVHTMVQLLHICQTSCKHYAFSIWMSQSIPDESSSSLSLELSPLTHVTSRLSLRHAGVSQQSSDAPLCLSTPIAAVLRVY